MKRVKRELTTEEWKAILDKADAAGIPHILFTGELTLRPDLPDLIAYTEKLELVCGLLTDGLRLADPKYLQSLLQAGLDHLMLVLAPDNDQSWEALQDALAEDIHVTVHVTLTPTVVKKYGAIFERLAGMGVKSVSLSTSDSKFAPQLKEARDLLAMKGLSLVWDMPVPYSDITPWHWIPKVKVSRVPEKSGCTWNRMAMFCPPRVSRPLSATFGTTLAGNMEKSSGLTPVDWHARYRLQAGWTAENSRLPLSAGIPCGCPSGSGGRLRQWCDLSDAAPDRSHAQVVGLDIDHPILKFAAGLDTSSGFVNGDALSLPFGDQTFDVVLCHYFLLWVRITPDGLERDDAGLPGGWPILALAEPDHAGRIDHPYELEVLGKLQTESLKHQGADHKAGRFLAGLVPPGGLAISKQAYWAANGRRVRRMISLHRNGKCSGTIWKPVSTHRRSHATTASTCTPGRMARGFCTSRRFLPQAKYDKS